VPKRSDYGNFRDLFGASQEPSPAAASQTLSSDFAPTSTSASPFSSTSLSSFGADTFASSALQDQSSFPLQQQHSLAQQQQQQQAFGSSPISQQPMSQLPAFGLVGSATTQPLQTQQQQQPFTQSQQQPPAFGSFGTPTSQQPLQPSAFGSFGTPTSQQPLQPSAFGSFGTTPTNQQPLQPPQQPSAFSSFGTTPASQQPLQPSAFGSFGTMPASQQTLQPPQQPAFGSFGASSASQQQSQPHQQSSTFGSGLSANQQLHPSAMEAQPQQASGGAFDAFAVPLAAGSADVTASFGSFGSFGQNASATAPQQSFGSMDGAWAAWGANTNANSQPSTAEAQFGQPLQPLMAQHQGASASPAASFDLFAGSTTTATAPTLAATTSKPLATDNQFMEFASLGSSASRSSTPGASAFSSSSEPQKALHALYRSLIEQERFVEAIQCAKHAKV
jgi:hypothetical protein